jgi:hypothetical protein
MSEPGQLMENRLKELEERVEALEKHLATVAASASKGEQAWWMQQPLGGRTV